MIVTLVIFTIHASALTTHEFNLGQTATVNFSAELSSSSEVCELFSLENEKPFYTHDQIDLTALKPGQVGRFSVNIIKQGSNFTAQLIITNVDLMDIGVYVLAVEEMNAQRTRHILDAYIDVTHPPGKAECIVQNSPYSPKLREVHCQATVSSSGGGLILCFQNGKKAPFITPVRHTESLITGVFWLILHQPSKAIRCCSFEANHEKDSDSCDDYEYQFSGEHSGTTSSPQSSFGDPGQSMFPLRESEIETTIQLTDRTIEQMFAYPPTPQNKDWSLNKLGIILSVICGIFFICTVVLAICLCSKKSSRSDDREMGGTAIEIEKLNGNGHVEPSRE